MKAVCTVPVEAKVTQPDAHLSQQHSCMTRFAHVSVIPSRWAGEPRGCCWEVLRDSEMCLYSMPDALASLYPRLESIPSSVMLVSGASSGAAVDSLSANRKTRLYEPKRPISTPPLACHKCLHSKARRSNAAPRQSPRAVANEAMPGLRLWPWCLGQRTDGE